VDTKRERLSLGGASTVRNTKSAHIFLFLAWFLFLFPVAVNAHPDTMVISVSVSPDATHQSTMAVPKGLAKRLLRCKTIPTPEIPELPRATISSGKRTFVLDSMSRLFEPQTRQQVVLPGPLHRELMTWVERAEQVHYGRLAHWDEVKREFRRLSMATIVDLETGEQFRVQRRAGSRHADVQPVTREDTRVMKRIYNGKWSWKRRAILVRVNDRAYAASMNGMPHGAGAITGNEFPGHFCIHFYGSTTHRRKTPDPRHSLMVWKASGRLSEVLMNAEPDPLVDAFLIFLQERDTAALRATTNGFALPEALNELVSVKRIRTEPTENSILAVTAELPVQVELIHKEHGRMKTVWVFHLGRRTLFDRWKITGLEMES